MRVDVVLPVLDPGAVGAHSVALSRLLREHGVESEVYAGEVTPQLAGLGRPLDQRRPGTARDVVVYQVAMGSDVGDAVGELRERLFLNHHNLTPPQYFEGWEPALVGGLRRGEEQLRRLAQRAELTLAVSEYNAAECRSAGCSVVEVAPFLFDPPTAAAAPAEVAQLRAASPGPTWLCVGRLCPNKAQHDLICAFAAHLRGTGGPGRLVLVGGSTPPAYEAALRRLVDELGLQGHVVLTGPVDDATLAAWYGAADVFVTLSEHEGFCVPVLEAWRAGLPVVALAEAALPETVGGAGLLVPSKRSPSFVAAAVAHLLDDAPLRARLIAAGARRLAERFSPEVARARTWAALAPRLS